MRDLQHRLNAQGCTIPPSEFGVFGAATESAVRRFQQSHGLVADGKVDESTWAALVESSYRLGDRLLYLKSPMLRGDDVAQLQRRLSSLGFDAGRVDGIFGPDTERALKDFQRNVAITVDGIFGPDTERAMSRLGNRVEQPIPVAGVRERERLRNSPRTLQDRRIMIGQSGGLDALASALAKSLTDAGARTLVSNHPDTSTLAQQANTFGADAFIGLGLANGDRCQVAYYATSGFESIGGHHLADLVVIELQRDTDLVLEPAAGMRLPVLRETRMPAVLCLLAPADLVVASTADIAAALRRAVGEWIAAPAGDPNT